MAIRPDYDIGTVNIVASSANFTTSGSSLQTAAVQAGDAIIAPSGHVLIIASITGQNSGTLFLPCPPDAAGTGLPLRIRFQPDGSRYQGAVRNLIDLLSSGNIEAFAALVGADGMVPIFTGPGTMDLADPATFGIQDPNGSLGKLAALTLAANKILNTNASGDLTQSDITAAALVLLKLAGTAAANKLPFFDSASTAGLADFTAAARALTNLSGAAAADRLPYLTGTNSAGLTALTEFARSVLDDTTGAAMFSTMGGASVLGSPGYQKLPSGLIIQWGGATPVSGIVSITLPTAFPTASICAFATAVGNPAEVVVNSNSSSSKTSLGFVQRYAASGGIVGLGSLPITWLALGY